MPENFALQCYLTLAFGFLGYIFEGTLLKLRNYCVIATIEAKNMQQAREIFLKEHIMKNNYNNGNLAKNIFVKI
jgi:hypothetical protein